MGPILHIFIHPFVSKSGINIVGLKAKKVACKGVNRMILSVFCFLGVVLVSSSISSKAHGVRRRATKWALYESVPSLPVVQTWNEWRGRFRSMVSALSDVDATRDDNQARVQRWVLGDLARTEAGGPDGGVGDGVALFYSDSEDSVGRFLSPSPWSALEDSDEACATTTTATGTTAAGSDNAWDAFVKRLEHSSRQTSSSVSYVPLIHSCLRLCQATYNLRLTIPELDAFAIPAHGPQVGNGETVALKTQRDSTQDNESNRPVSDGANREIAVVSLDPEPQPQPDPEPEPVLEPEPMPSLLERVAVGLDLFPAPSLGGWGNDSIISGTVMNFTSESELADDFWESFAKVRNKARWAVSRTAAAGREIANTTARIAAGESLVSIGGVTESIMVGIAMARAQERLSDGAVVDDPNRDGTVLAPSELRFALDAVECLGLPWRIMADMRGELIKAIALRERQCRDSQRLAVGTACDALGYRVDCGEGGMCDVDGGILCVKPLVTDKACALFVHDTAAEHAVFAFRGTREPLDVATDLSFLSTSPFPNESDVGSIEVHSGFQAAYDSIRPLVEEALAQMPSGTQVVFTGHSLGGALASLAALEYAYLHSHQGHLHTPPPLLITAGAPAVGNEAFVDYMSRHVAPLGGLRIFNKGDVVPLLAVPVGYRHAGVPIMTTLDPRALELFQTLNIDPDAGGTLPVAAPHILFSFAGLVHVFPIMGVDVKRAS